MLQSAGLLFFAFAGYARIATLGEEVRDPERNIPRAIMIALVTVLVVYAAVGVTVLTVLGPVGLGSSGSPLVDVVRVSGWADAGWVVRIGAGIAALGALLGLIAGVGRTMLAMARTRDIPAWFATLDPVHGVPRRAQVVLGVVVIGLVLTVDLRNAIGFLSFGVLLYYFVANVAAFTQTPAHRRYPRGAQILGMVGCLVLVIALPAPSLIGGMAVVAAGVVYRILRRRRHPHGRS